MMRLRDIPIVAKLLLGPLGGSIVIAGIVVQFLFSYNDISRTVGEAEQAGRLQADATNALLTFTSGHSALLQAVSAASAFMAADVVDVHKKAAAGDMAKARKALAAIAPGALPVDMARVEDARKVLAAYVQEATGILDYLDINAFAAATAMTDMARNTAATEAGMRALADHMEEVQGALRERAAQTLDGSLTRMMMGAGFAIVALFVGSVIFARLLSAPIRQITAAMADIAAGRLETAMPSDVGRDEIGEMARTLSVFKANAVETQRLVGLRQREQEEREHRFERLSSAMRDLDQRITQVVDQLNRAASGLTEVSNAVASTVHEVGTKSAEAVSGASQAVSSVNEVVSLAGELSASIEQVGDEVSRSALTATRAVEEAARANATMTGLADAAKQIGAVVNLIDSIASQTNLLALNATIEAARAGEAGKGFAIVANEVKHLATQTAKATDDIRQQIGGVQQTAEEALEAIGRIVSTISDVNTIATGIAGTIERQNEAIRRMAESTDGVAHCSGAVLQSIQQVYASTESASRGAGHVLDAASVLGEDARLLRETFDGFRQRVGVV